jgi:alpha-amylase/alpha-mannosidase (GH57 family)
MHQPPGNLRLLIEREEWEAQQIIRCYERAARYAHTFHDTARLHVGFSGVLLEQLRDREIVDRYRKFLDIPAMLERYCTATNIELIGMGYYHPVFPLIPEEDWKDHLVAGRQMMLEVFGREPKGFWPPEMAFTMEMIPALVAAG